MPKIGYARVSSSSQDLDIQKAKLTEAGCEVIRPETVSGASRDDRSELATVMEFLREGDELVVHRLDRLGRSTRDVLNLVLELDAKGASLRVLEPEVTTAGDMGRMVITVFLGWWLIWNSSSSVTGSVPESNPPRARAITRGGGNLLMTMKSGSWQMLVYPKLRSPVSSAYHI